MDEIQMNDVEQILGNIYNEVYERNSLLNERSVPLSDEIYDYISKKYNIIGFAVANLFKALVNSHRLFSFAVVEANRKNRKAKIDGFVVCKADMIAGICAFYEDILIKLYSNEVHKKLPADKILIEAAPLAERYINTEIGRILNIVLNLKHCQTVLEKNIMQYGKHFQEKQLKLEMEKLNPESIFININPKHGASSESKQNKIKKPVDDKHNNDAESDIKLGNVEKSLAVYGVEFYTRVCFRNYQFSHMIKLVETEAISGNADLLTIKNLLQKERASADHDLKLQEYARDINELEKAINNKIKKASSS
jgi:hypothetical protein